MFSLDIEPLMLDKILSSISPITIIKAKTLQHMGVVHEKA